MAGVAVGNVHGVELKGDHVDVTFKLDKGTELGRDTGAAIKVRTLLGAEFLALTPSGPGELEKGATIPISRTVPPYNVVEAFSDLSTTTDELDVERGLQGFRGLTRRLPRGLPRSSAARSRVCPTCRPTSPPATSRSTRCWSTLKRFSAVLNATGPDLERLFKDATVLFDAISERRAAVHRLLVSTHSDLQGASGLGQGREV